jgi:hypothetical protein
MAKSRKRRKLFVPTRAARSRIVGAGVDAAVGYAGERLKSVGVKGELLDTVTPRIKNYLEASVQDLDIDGVCAAVEKTASKMKTPRAKSGRNLNKTKRQLMDQPAVSGTTESNCMFSYRPKRAKKTTDTMYYHSIRNKKLTLTSTDGFQIAADRNLMLLVPPKNDDMKTDTSYCNISVKNEFDRMLKARFIDKDGAAVEGLKDTLIADYHILSSVMIIKAPDTGAIVDIYDIQPRFGLGPATRYNEQLAIDGHLSPLNCWDKGLTSAVTIDTEDDYRNNVVGSEPLESPTFRRTFNIIKKTTVRMTSNSIHRHRHVFNINKSITYDEMAQSSVDGGSAPWCPTQLVVVRGYPTATSLAAACTIEIQQETKLSYSSRLAKTTNVIVYNNNT